MSDENGGRATRPTSFWLDDETRRIMDKISSQTGMSRSAIVREALGLMDADPSNVEIRRLVKELAAATGT